MRFMSIWVCFLSKRWVMSFIRGQPRTIKDNHSDAPDGCTNPWPEEADDIPRRASQKTLAHGGDQPSRLVSSLEIRRGAASPPPTPQTLYGGIMAAPRKYKHTRRVPADESKPLKFWQAVVELARADNGDRRRKFVRSKNRDKAEALYAQAIKDREAGGGDMPTRAITVAGWFAEWFEPIHVLEIKPKTAHTYRGLIAREILPHIGAIKLERLNTRDIRQMLTAVVTTSGTNHSGLSSTTAAQVHRITSVALKAAVAEGHVPRNVAALVKPPRRAATNLTALSADEARKVLSTAMQDEKWPSLWWAVLLTGARQGELLGLELDRVGTYMDLSWQLQRLTWEHGCSPHCGRKRGADCRQRKITAPADWNARHLQGGLWLTSPKTKAGSRIVPISQPLALAMRLELDATADMPNPHGLMWRMPDGSPIDPRVQSEAWHNLLARAGVPDIRLHDGRHTAVDMLYDSGVEESELPGIVGHSTRQTTRGYRSNSNLTRRSEAMERLAAMIIPTDTPQAVGE